MQRPLTLYIALDHLLCHHRAFRAAAGRVPNTPGRTTQQRDWLMPTPLEPREHDNAKQIAYVHQVDGAELGVWTGRFTWWNFGVNVKLEPGGHHAAEHVAYVHHADDMGVWMGLDGS